MWLTYYKTNVQLPQQYQTPLRTHRPSQDPNGIFDQLPIGLLGEAVPGLLHLPQPGVLEGLPGTGPALWIHLQQPLHELPALAGDELWHLGCVEVVLLLVLRKGRSHGKHFIKQHPCAPNVYLIVVVGALCHLGRDVVHSATEGAPVGLRLDAPPEVGYLQVVVEAYYVLRLQVSVHHSVAVKVLQPRQDLCNVVGPFAFTERAVLEDDAVKVVKAVLHHQEHLVTADVVAIGRKDVRVFAVEVNLHLVHQVLQLGLVPLECLYGHHHPVVVGSRQQDLPRLRLPYPLKHSKHVPGLLGLRSLQSARQVVEPRSRPLLLPEEFAAHLKVGLGGVKRVILGSRGGLHLVEGVLRPKGFAFGRLKMDGLGLFPWTLRVRFGCFVASGVG